MASEELPNRRKTNCLWRIFPSVMAPILHWFHLQKSLIFVVKRQCLSDVFFRERNVYFTRLTLYVLMESWEFKNLSGQELFLLTLREV